jgi:hypothetical protein
LFHPFGTRRDGKYEEGCHSKGFDKEGLQRDLIKKVCKGMTVMKLP